MPHQIVKIRQQINARTDFFFFLSSDLMIWVYVSSTTVHFTGRFTECDINSHQPLAFLIIYATPNVYGELCTQIKCHVIRYIAYHMSATVHWDDSQSCIDVRVTSEADWKLCHTPCYSLLPVTSFFCFRSFPIWPWKTNLHLEIPVPNCKILGVPHAPPPPPPPLIFGRSWQIVY